MFWQDDKDKPSVKKIIVYSIVIFVVLALLGFVGERMDWV